MASSFDSGSPKGGLVTHPPDSLSHSLTVHLLEHWFSAASEFNFPYLVLYTIISRSLLYFPACVHYYNHIAPVYTLFWQTRL